VGIRRPAGGIGAALPNFASGGGLILTSLGIPQNVGAVFMALVLCSFLLTSTDTAVRLGRYMMEELVGTPAGRSDTGLNLDPRSIARGRYTNPIVQIVPAYLLVVSGQWVVLWQLFGGANQLLAALALLTATVWLANWDDNKQLISTGVPMAIMVTITVLGLSILVFYENLYLNLLEGGAETTEAMISSGVQMALGLVLIGLALALVRLGYKNIQTVRRGPETPAAEPGDDWQRPTVIRFFQPLDTPYRRTVCNRRNDATARTVSRTATRTLFGRAHVVPEGKRLHDVGGLAGDVCFDFRDDDEEVDLVVTVIAELQ